MEKHEENFNPGDLITGTCLCGHNVHVIEQIHQWVKVRFTYKHNEEQIIDCIHNNLYKVRYGEF